MLKESRIFGKNTTNGIRSGVSYCKKVPFEMWRMFQAFDIFFPKTNKKITTTKKRRKELAI